MIYKRFRSVFLGLTAAVLLMTLTVSAAFAQESEQEIDQDNIQTNVAVGVQTGVAVSGPTIAVFGDAEGGDAVVVQELEINQRNEANQMAQQVLDDVGAP